MLSMAQLTFAEAQYATKKRKIRREVFLEKMDALIPWKQLEKKLSKPYRKGRTGRPPYPLSTCFTLMACSCPTT